MTVDWQAAIGLSLDIFVQNFITDLHCCFWRSKGMGRMDFVSKLIAVLFHGNFSVKYQAKVKIHVKAARVLNYEKFICCVFV